MIRAVLVILMSLCCAVSGFAVVTPDLVTVKVDERPTLELVEQLAAQCQSGISADPAILQELQKPISLSLDHVSWDRARQVIANAIGLDLSLSGELLRVTTPSRALETGRLRMQVYNVTSIIRTAPSHSALPLDLTHALDDWEGVVDRFPTEPAPAKSETNEVVDVLQHHVEPASWGMEGVAIETWKNEVVVTNTPATHAKVMAQLAHLEAMAQRQCICRFYRLEQLPLGTSTVLTAQEWSVLASKSPSPAAVFLVHNEQRQRHFSGIQRAIIIDTEQNQSQHVPLARVVSTGLSLSLLPTIMVDAVRVQARFWATVDAQYSHHAVSDEAGHPLVNIITPHLTMDQADDLREIPLGGAAIYRFGERSYALTVEVVDLPGLNP